HNLPEHEASLSRSDFGFAGHIKFNKTIFAALASANPRKDLHYYDTTSARQVMYERLANSLATNPKAVNTLKEFVLRTHESAFSLSVFDDPLTGIKNTSAARDFTLRT
ncbi:hypothetical protein C8J57DRAFT_1077792, partial [Mycena rebaudengoi]